MVIILSLGLGYGIFLIFNWFSKWKLIIFNGLNYNLIKDVEGLVNEGLVILF